MPSISSGAISVPIFIAPSSVEIVPVKVMVPGQSTYTSAVPSASSVPATVTLVSEMILITPSISTIVVALTIPVLFTAFSKMAAAVLALIIT